MSEATAPPPARRSAIDTLVARDRTAVFWFLAACAVAGGCAWYMTLMAEVLKDRPPFVVMDTSGSYYVPPGIHYAEMDAMHLNLAELMAETLLERTPEGLTYKDRLSLLCLEDAYEDITRNHMDKEEKYFTAQKATQTAVLESREIVKRITTTVATTAKGKVYRRSFFGGKEVNEVFNFTITLIWRQNEGIRTNKAFPSRVEKVHELKLEKLSDS